MQVGGLGNFNFGLRALAQNQEQVAQSYERLATGKRVNRASDDPSAIVPIEQNRSRLYSLEIKLKSITRQESFLGAKEGGLSVINDSIIELNGLVVQAANTAGNSEEELKAISLEIQSVLDSIDHIAITTTYNGQQILSEYSVGSIAEELKSLASLAIDDPEAAQEIAQRGVDVIVLKRASIGNALKSLESGRRTVSKEIEAVAGFLSSLEDTDYAAETAKLVRAQILEQAAILAIDVQRQSAKQVLSLLEGATDTK